MLKINGKVFLNIQEAVGWLMANNALPFQCTANYAADTEIPLSDIVNPSPAEVRIGSIIFFADSKAATVTGITDDSFTVGADHIDMGDIHHVTGDVSITGDLSVQNINVAANANVGKLNSEKLNQKYEGAIKAELHVDEQGIAEAVNPGNTGRFETTRVIKPSEVKTEIYDTQASKRMSFRLPYFEASAGNHRLLTEEDLGGGGSSLLEDIEDADGHKAFEMYSQDEAPEDTTPLYVKGIRNGNVLTLICCTTVSNAQNASKTIGYIKLPSYILDKLILGQWESNIIGVTSSGVNAGGSTMQVTTRWYKESDGVRIVISGLSAFSGGNIRASYTLGL